MKECKDCRFSFATKHPSHIEGGAECFLCLRYAPKPSNIEGTNSPYRSNAYYPYYPIVAAACGEFEPKKIKIEPCEKEIHDILLSRKEACVLVKQWDFNFNHLSREERKLYAELIDRLKILIKH